MIQANPAPFLGGTATDPQYDVAIVGASIAGCTAATLYARRGLHVALLERRKDPDGYKKICTHFIQASATPVIQRLGLDTMIEDAGGLRNGVEFWMRWGWNSWSNRDHIASRSCVEKAILWKEEIQ